MAQIPGVARVRLSKEASLRMLRLGSMDGYPVETPEHTIVRVYEDGGADVVSPLQPAEWPDVMRMAFDGFSLSRRHRRPVDGGGPSAVAHAWAAMVADAAGPGVDVLTEPAPKPKRTGPLPSGIVT